MLVVYLCGHWLHRDRGISSGSDQCVCLSVCLSVCVCLCVHACLRVSVRACVSVCASVQSLGPNASHTLIKCTCRVAKSSEVASGKRGIIVSIGKEVRHPEF